MSTETENKAEFFQADSASVFHRAATLILNVADAAKGPIILMMPGGRTVSGVCQTLLQIGPAHKDGMHRINLFEADSFATSDVRPETNWDVLSASLMKPAIDAGLMDKSQFHPFTLMDDHEAAANAYGLQLAGMGTVPRVVILGTGGGEFSAGIEDTGHVAAIFPGPAFEHVWSSNKRYVALHDAPKPPSTRYTATPNFILDSDVVIGLITTEGKRNALKNYRAGMAPRDCPIRLVDFMRHGKGYLLTDIKG